MLFVFWLCVEEQPCIWHIPKQQNPNNNPPNNIPLTKPTQTSTSLGGERYATWGAFLTLVSLNSPTPSPPPPRFPRIMKARTRPLWETKGRGGSDPVDGQHPAAVME